MLKHYVEAQYNSLTNYEKFRKATNKVKKEAEMRQANAVKKVKFNLNKIPNLSEIGLTEAWLMLKSINYL